ncbi:mechanosensitive ion channel family protein [Alcaligenes endophyticus]|uniref:Mechanosensitive ion channel family protein n=1 Tax=Alcaligenes endophyticus TaxID=1929088 RepID=A0ABT8EK34_9BURK|nr:mechanosensitive ion channel domain-containing protein [Alcaligenes endophyticus]MCX5591951.1 mechanosensitive ion channel [Alcaligenes endophyticus]MDN4121641.1 mechanosensitive ion channel family protein [Alcaligenes endophyticus]
MEEKFPTEPPLAEWLNWSVIESWFPSSLWAQVALALVALLLTMALASWITSRVLSGLFKRLLRVAGQEEWIKALAQHKVVRYCSYAVPAYLFVGNVALLPVSEAWLISIARMAATLATVLTVLALVRLLAAWQQVYAASNRGQTRSIKGYIELAKIALWAIGVIFVISILMDQSPLLLLSGLGALSAVLLLVFKDTLLSLVASTQMSSNDMLRIGDWIEMKQAGADGFVIDIALHTVKVQNWDKTVTTIPTYKLFSESYRNWRQMFESGGRRIKRTLSIDATSVRFLSDVEIEDLSRFALLDEYLKEKKQQLRQTNTALAQSGIDRVNHRRLSNIGTFRAYCMAYIQQHPGIHQGMIMMVRMMEPGAEGIPIEIYCFTNNTAWVEFERIQGDIFDHFLAILPEMSLRLFQTPTGYDLSQGLSMARHAASLGDSNNNSTTNGISS